jgi:hypothetical protein
MLPFDFFVIFCFVFIQLIMPIARTRLNLFYSILRTCAQKRCKITKNMANNQTFIEKITGKHPTPKSKKQVSPT